MTLLSRSCIALARLAQYLPKGKFRLATFFLRIASDDSSTLSVYGPRLANRWHDTTFRFCVSGYYGRYFSDFLRRLNYPFSFVDIGANIGLYSLIAAQNPYCKNGYAFEPNPTVFVSLQQNLLLNNAAEVKAHNLAISETSGCFYFSASEAHSGVGRPTDKRDEGSIEVQCSNHEIFDKIATFDRLQKIVKIDVEGHEPLVIDQLIKSSMWEDIRCLYFEANEERYDIAALLQRLDESGLSLIYQEAQGGDRNLMFERRQIIK